MSVIYMGVAADRDNVGVVIFKRPTEFVVSKKAVLFERNKGELLRAGFIKNPCGDRTDVSACLAQAVAIRKWFDEGPPVGGAWVPEQFIFGASVAKKRPTLAGALMMAWCDPERAESIIHDAQHKEGPLWFHTVPELELSPDAGGDKLTKEDVLGRLSDEERVTLLAQVRKRSQKGLVLEAVGVGLLHLGRLSR